MGRAWTFLSCSTNHIFSFFTTVRNFIWKKILEHIARLALQNAEKKQEGWEQQGGVDRLEENLTPGRTVQGLGRNSLHAICQSSLQSWKQALDPGNAAGREAVP